MSIYYFQGVMLGSVPQLRPHPIPSNPPTITLDRPGFQGSYPSRLGPIVPVFQSSQPVIELVRGTPQAIQRFMDPSPDDSQLSYSEYLSLVTGKRRRANESRPPSSALSTSSSDQVFSRATVAFPLQQYGQPPLSASAQSLQVMETLFANMHALLASSVMDSTQYTYGTGWKRWLVYCLYIGTDKFLRSAPESYQNYVALSGDPAEWSFPILACAGYMAYLVNHPTDPVEADPATKYLSAVRYHFTTNGIDVAFMDSSPFLKAARAGLIKQWRQIPGNSISDRQTLPVCIGMLEQAAAETLHIDTNLSHFGLLIACIIAYTLLCRVSEYLRRPRSNHHLKAKSVVFWIAHENPTSVTMASPYLSVSASNAWQVAHLRHRLLGGNFCIKDSKKDPFGAGFVYPIPRHCPGPRSPDFVYDFVEMTFDFAVKARPLPEQPFISSSHKKISVTSDTMNIWLKEVVAPMFGLNPKLVHTHSLRFSGASTLSAAHVPDSIIMRMGRWASLAFLHYIRLSASTFIGVAAALANRTSFTIQDVRNLMPGAAL